MDEYTWEDIIINPISKEAKTWIGKKAYYANSPKACLLRANHDDKDYLDKLINIYPDHLHPFWFGTSFENAYGCIILEKEKEEPKPEYIPFDTVEEFVKASLIHNKEHYLNGTGIWIKEPHSEDNESCISMVNSLCTYDNTIYVDDRWMNLNQILKSYSFLDDTQCGKLKEEI